jgi:hypothetical protein
MLGGIYAAAGRALGGAGRTAAMGGAAGAAWGAVSGDTSVIGGALMGAGMGLGGRYAKAGVKGFMRSGKPAVGPAWPMKERLARARNSMMGQLRGDAISTGSRLQSNTAVQSLGKNLKSWGQGR